MHKDNSETKICDVKNLCVSQERVKIWPFPDLLKLMGFTNEAANSLRKTLHHLIRLDVLHV
uniref:Uncharacterized protein n=1 Tax=Arundo donax TaxID=35708 RepID=A0A0A9SMW8_ARUDO